MKSYKKLKSKKKIIDKRATITELHENKMKEFDNYYKTLPEKKENLKKLQEKIKNIDKNDYNNILLLKDLHQEERELKKEINNIIDQTDLSNYLISFAKIISKQQDIQQDDNQQDNQQDNNQDNQQDNNQQDNNKQDNQQDNQQNNQPKKVGINKYIIVEKGNQKGKLMEEYLATCLSDTTIQCSTRKNIFTCENCKEDCIVNHKECYLTCTNCGQCKEWQDPDIPQWSDEVDVSKAYRYKRLGYFIEHLYRVQAKECTVIPENVISKLLLELKKRRITEPDKITSKLIKSFLKNLDLTTYYDNVNSIIRTLSGKEAPVFPEELEDKLVVMFMRTQEPFEKYKHLIPERNNYLSYPYVIRQLLIIISKNEDNDNLLKFVKMFPLLKSRIKLWYQEKVWEKICEECDWTFFPSI